MVERRDGLEKKALGEAQPLIVTVAVARSMGISSDFTTSLLLTEGVVSNNYIAAILSNEIGFLHSKR